MYLTNQKLSLPLSYKLILSGYKYPYLKDQAFQHL